jgi:FMN phosphatase YigB (HAD superfamily)
MTFPNEIRAILFDLDGTLLHDRPRYNDILAKLAVEYIAPDAHPERCRAERWMHYYWAQSSDVQLDLANYGELNQAFWENHTRRYLIAFGYTPDHAAQACGEISRRMGAEFNPTSWVPPDVFEVLRVLKAAGFLLGIVSNRSNPIREELHSLGLDQWVDVSLAAGEVNSWKPDAGIFIQAVLDLQVKPAETLYVGDNYYADVIGARNAGIRPVLLDPDGLFPEVECDVIRSLNDLIGLTRRNPE